MVINLCFSVLQWCWGPFASWARPRPFLAIHPCCLKKPSMPSHMQMCSLDFTDPKKPPGLNNNHPKLVNRAAVQHSLPSQLSWKVHEMMDDGHVFVVHWFMGMVHRWSPNLWSYVYNKCAKKKKKGFYCIIFKWHELLLPSPVLGEDLLNTFIGRRYVWFAFWITIFKLKWLL